MSRYWQMTAKDFEELERANVMIGAALRQAHLANKLFEKVLNRASKRVRDKEMREHPERWR